DPEQPHHLGVGAAEHHLAASAAIAVTVETLPGAHDQGNAGRVDEVTLGEVDHHPRALVGPEGFEAPVELGSGVHVELTAHGKSPNSVLEPLPLNSKRNRIHPAILAQGIWTSPA